MSKDNVTITVSSFYNPKKWEVLQIGSSKSWNIVTEISKPDNLGFTLTTTPINLSRWKWIRNFQIRMLNKIFKQSQ